MTHPDYIRDKAIEMRIERDLTIDEIAERLAISRQTIYHWVKDIPMRRPRRTTRGLRMRDRGNSDRYKLLRDAAYAEGLEQFDELATDPTFRDFVCMYIGEGSKRNRNRVALCNSDPRVMVLGERWIRRCSSKRVTYAIQYHADQDLDEIRRFWADTLGIDPELITLQRKSNSNAMRGRQWRSQWGVLTITANDTQFRARLGAWMDRVRQEWLDSTSSGV